MILKTLISCTLLFTACGDFIDIDVAVNEHIEITFDTRGGDNVPVLRSPRWESVTLPTPAYDGYVFTGWYSAPEGGRQFGDENNAHYVDRRETMYARWRSRLNMDPGDTLISGIVFALVEAGTFTMGSPIDDEDRYEDEVRREVTLTRNFWISKYPVTNRQFGRAVPEGEEDYPVVNVTWYEASAFAEGKGGQLPTEAQWEFAARGGNAGKSDAYIYSGGNTLSDVGWYQGNSGGRPHPVGGKRPNQLGIYDMSGGVFEWVSDWRGVYGDDPVTDPQGPELGPGRISRGGSWDSEARECRVADRAYSAPGMKNEFLGFRVLVVLE